MSTSSSTDPRALTAGSTPAGPFDPSDVSVVRDYSNRPDKPYLSTYGEDLGYTPEASKLYNDRLAYIAAILSRAAFRRLDQFRKLNDCPSFPETFSRMTQLQQLYASETPTEEEEDLLDTVEACFPPEDLRLLLGMMRWLRWDPSIEFLPEVQQPDVLIGEDEIRRSMFGWSADNGIIIIACEPFLQDQLICSDIPREQRRAPAIFDKARDMVFENPEERQREHNSQILKDYFQRNAAQWM